MFDLEKGQARASSPQVSARNDGNANHHANQSIQSHNTWTENILACSSHIQSVTDAAAAPDASPSTTTRQVTEDKGRPSGWRGIVYDFGRDSEAQKNMSSGTDNRPVLTRGNHSTIPGQIMEKPHQTTSANFPTAGLQQGLKQRHMSVIAASGCIGTGLFIASGKALNAGGPASILITFTLIGIMLFMTMHSMAEMSVLYPVAGSFANYSSRFLDPAWGFSMGWNYAMQWLTVLPLELIAASITIGFWDHDHINHDIWVGIFWILVVTINLFGVKGFGEAEFICGLVKIAAVVGYIILGVILDCGGTPAHDFIGGKYWHDPGPFRHGFKGLCSVFVTAAFSFAGTELIGLTSAECQNPAKEMPKAIKGIFWRIVLFYVLTLTIVGLLVPYNDPYLLSSGHVRAAASPFVISIQTAGIAILPSIMNAVILTAVISVANSSIYGSSRTLAALAEQHQAPSFLGYVDRKGRPLFAMAIGAALGLIGFTACSRAEGEVLDWMLALSGLSSIFTWASICLAHIRFRQAWARRGRLPIDLPYRSPCGVWGSYVALVFNVVVLGAQFWVGAWPIGYGAVNQAESFFKAYLGFPILLLFFLVFKACTKSRFVSLKLAAAELDVGRRAQNSELSPRELNQQLDREWTTLSLPMKLWRILY